MVGIEEIGLQVDLFLRQGRCQRGFSVGRRE